MSEYIGVPLQVGPKAVHTVFVRRQVQSRAQRSQPDSDSDSDDDSADKAVFVTNLPLDTTEDNIRDICKALGDVVLDRYIYQGTRHGLISLVDESAASRFLAKARKLADKGRKHAVAWTQYGPRGAEGYIAHHYAKFPEEHELQEKADEYMALFAEQEEQDRREAEEAAEQVDEDGFRLVVYKNRKRLADIEALSAVDVAPRKKRSLEKTDFYRFQLREQRKQEMSSLLQRFQHDKEKVEELKQRRKYRPY